MSAVKLATVKHKNKKAKNRSFIPGNNGARSGTSQGTSDNTSGGSEGKSRPPKKSREGKREGHRERPFEKFRDKKKDSRSAPEKTIKGKVVVENGNYFVFPLGEDKKSVKQGGKGAKQLRLERLFIPKRFIQGTKAGALVIAEDMGEYAEHLGRVGRIISTIDTEISFPEVSRAFFKNFHLTSAYPAKALEEADAFPEPEFDPQGKRRDYRHLHVVTIDPVTARDHDDAISLERLPNGNWQVGVHIADVAEYVKSDSSIDKEAQKRAFTQYLPWTAAPMLPHRLSSDLCSLLEGKDRFAFSCMMEVDGMGEVKHYEFVESMIRVAKFYAYEEAQKQKDEGDETLKLLDTFANILKDKRRRDGFIDFQFPEARVELDENGVPKRIYAGEHLASHSWIEECMLLANQVTAMFLTKNKIPGHFRVHEQPDLDVVSTLRNLVGPEMGSVGASKELAKSESRLKETKGYLNPGVQQFFIHLLNAGGKNLPVALQRKILQSMKKAQYSHLSLGHFALGWEHYAHFTSPIRRYADLWTHRVMKLFLQSKKAPAALKPKAAHIAEWVSERELEVMKVERKAMRVAVAWIFQEYIGDEFDAEISGVENFGLFVQIRNPYGEGMIPVSRLRDDYYEKDMQTGMLVGKRKQMKFALGDKIRVRLEKSDPIAAQVDFDFLGKL